MDFVKQKCRVLVLSLVPPGGKPKDAIELVFRNMYVHPNITERFLEEGYTMTISTDERDIMVDARYANYREDCWGGAVPTTTGTAQKAMTKSPAPRRKPTPKPVDVAPKRSGKKAAESDDVIIEE